jgi:PAS domain S-box-containing protein
MSSAERAELVEVMEEVVGLGTYVWIPGKTISWSRGFYRLLGLDPNEPAAPEMFYARVHPDDRARVIMAASTVVTKGTVDTFPYRLVRDDGSSDWVAGSTQIEHDADGNVARVIGTILRITDLHGANERLAQVNALLAETQRAAGVGSYVYELASRRREWSDELYRVLGVTPGAVVDDALAGTLVHDDDRQHQREWGAAVARGESMPPLLARMVRADDKRVIYVETRARLVQRPGGPCILGVCLDVTARVEMEQELRHVARTEAVGALAAGVAHDFNNYLTVLSAQLDLMRLHGGVPRPKDLDTMNSALERCAGLVRQLLAFARKHPYRPERLDLAARVETVRALFERVVEPSLNIEVAITTRPVVQGDATQLDGALMNLLVNARDAMTGGGTLRLELDERELAEGDPRLEGRLTPGRYARLAVSDTGVGIAPEHLPHVFEPYFTTKRTGTGLGLAITRKIVEALGGAIRLESRPGLLTRIEIELPPTPPAGVAPEGR